MILERECQIAFLVYVSPFSVQFDGSDSIRKGEDVIVFRLDDDRAFLVHEADFSFYPNRNQTFGKINAARALVDWRDREVPIATDVAHFSADHHRRQIFVIIVSPVERRSDSRPLLIDEEGFLAQNDPRHASVERV